ncbi:tRNA threonylcarbamoyladenosine dehydratase [Tepidibacter thalassicus]|uniref:tRNA A37 threonylcarbamoyladenosine dehydratase n=1 Tax=Tepidibacter thalassicus DSM 15285 TaxID=1123350 RepID=A0A1M5NHE0_9FIRM|nr:tRNA threonylcarbamoyladenosine dehydratase [Tepidibacter thalassicus]SHG88984.1 tRNA A37 threonylcarbamoyladenosine dehydratase [Tepidibacter thalassicus DSM 15285]
MEKSFFMRTQFLLGNEGLEKLKVSKVAVFGIGGVGSYVVEALARAGVGNLILIDHDEIDITNINRQIHALYTTVGKSKVDVMKNRILDINPNANVIAYKKLYNKDSANELLSEEYDYVVDAIDMVSSKIDLIERCYNKGINIISSMGMGNKLDPTKIEVSDIYKTHMCPLAKVMRRELRARKIKKLKVVYSTEKPIKPVTSILNDNKREIPGSISFVPSVGGLIMASVVVKDLIGM